MDVFPSSSESTGVQLIEADLIKAMNQYYLFDFEYEPERRDYLAIKLDANSDVYLNLVFLEGQWQEKVFLDTSHDQQLDNYYLFSEEELSCKSNFNSFHFSAVDKGMYFSMKANSTSCMVGLNYRLVLE
ncbi:MAG: hypothetical protein AAF960_27980 [Bacteroidota bacterium]